MNPVFSRVQFFRKQSVLIFLVIAAIAIFAAFHYDAEFRCWVISAQGPDWKHSAAHSIFAKLSTWGDWPPLIGAGILATLIARGLGSASWTRILAMAVISAALAGIIATTSRSLTGRTRPAADPTILPGWYGPYSEGHCLIGKHDYNSFPSGHTATAVGLAAVILFSRPLFGVPCMLVALSISASRLYLGQHHLSDVVVAFFLGLGVGWCCWQIARTYPKN